MSTIKASFSGHDKFDCKLDWLIKGLSNFDNNNEIFLEKNIEIAIEKLGLGKNMIKSLKHWLSIFNLIEKKSITPLGKIILEKDPYLETTDIFWLLHWNLIKNRERASLYYLFFTEFFPNRFTSETLTKTVTEYMSNYDNKISRNTIFYDVEVFRKIYMGLLKELSIIDETNNEYFLDMRTIKNISNDMFTYILMDYLEKFNSEFSSISLESLQVGKTSLQKMLCMNENDFMNRIYSIEKISDNLIKYSDNAGERRLEYKKYDKYHFLKTIFVK